MPTPLHLAVERVCCPEDGGTLQIRPDALRCEQCQRNYRVYDDRVVDFLPSAPLHDGDSRYAEQYQTAFRRPFSLPPDGIAWGAQEVNRPSWVGKRTRQVASVRKILTRGVDPARHVLCDISAGAGYYTLDFAPRFQTVFHCELSLEALSYAYRRARSLGLSNVLFFRIDYFRPPFRASIDRIICMDTLIQGEEHEQKLLASIKRSLRPDGCAVVDFHNWWHNPARRMGLLPQNFGEHRSYRLPEVRQLMERAGVGNCSYVPFRQERIAAIPGLSLLAKALPPTRHMYLFRQ